MNYARFVVCSDSPIITSRKRRQLYHMGIVSSTLCRGEGAQVSALSMSPSNGDDGAENWNEFHISLSNDELERCFPDAGIVDMEDEVEWDMKCLMN